LLAAVPGVDKSDQSFLGLDVYAKRESSSNPEAAGAGLMVD
jgi:hypothetical protein